MYLKRTKQSRYCQQIPRFMFAAKTWIVLENSELEFGTGCVQVIDYRIEVALGPGIDAAAGYAQRINAKA